RLDRINARQRARGWWTRGCRSGRRVGRRDPARCRDRLAALLLCAGTGLYGARSGLRRAALLLDARRAGVGRLARRVVPAATADLRLSFLQVGLPASAHSRAVTSGIEDCDRIFSPPISEPLLGGLPRVLADEIGKDVGKAPHHAAPTPMAVRDFVG